MDNNNEKTDPVRVGPEYRGLRVNLLLYDAIIYPEYDMT